MEQVTQQQVIAFLKQRQRQLSEELRSIEMTINSILGGQSVSSPSYGSGTFGREEDFPRRKKVIKALVPQEEFNPNSKLDQKISYALTQIGSGYKDDILAVLNKAQPEADPYKVEKAVAVRLSYLLKNEFIDGVKHGRSYKYSLK
ncbi:soluble adenylyl cyclase-like protein [Olivibacter sp. SDN3]|uniref:soluble adenylyl cyclase-like protein n=1 Tax=Olivibacter sp. SDN3 TaxID=2764720 RepID=UPI00165144A6|nr:soluble adenylyl cyclase-like protein [Olivibacter sp. SDN3]QNL50623.1 soluble adenylyl cyclase-like protein [Olivibacter sp. SDN3]